MATRMQQRRGTAAQWISTNSGNGPILNAGEIGWESDTNKFKMGDGTNTWLALDYFADINSTVNPAFGSSITFEGATANDYETVLAVTDPTADRTITLPNVTGTVITTGNLSDITDIGVFTSTIVMEGSTADAHELTLSAGNPTQDHTLTFPNSTGTVATQEYVDSSVDGAEVDQSTLAGTGIDWNAATNKFDVNTTEIQAKVANVTDTEIGYLDGVTSAIQTQLNDKAPLASPALTGTATAVNLTISGNLTVDGTTTNINSTNLVIEDKNVVLGDTATPTDTTADGGGITLKGLTDKTFNWVDATDAWTSSEHINLASGKALYLNGTLLKDATETLTNKTLTSPVLTTPTLSTIDAAGDLLVGTADNTLGKISIGTSGYVLTSNGTTAAWAAAAASGTDEQLVVMQAL